MALLCLYWLVGNTSVEMFEREPSIFFSLTNDSPLSQLNIYQTSKFGSFIKWATSWESLFLPYANNKGADQPAHSRSLISVFVFCCLDSITTILFKSKLSSLYLVSVNAQTGLSLPWSQTPKTGFLMMRRKLTLDRLLAAAKKTRIRAWAQQNWQNHLSTQQRLWMKINVTCLWWESCCPHEEAWSPCLSLESTANSDQTERMPRVFWVFAGCTSHFVGFFVLWLNLISNGESLPRISCRQYVYKGR